jgi:hypothetical protein
MLFLFLNNFCGANKIKVGDSGWLAFQADASVFFARLSSSCSSPHPYPRLFYIAQLYNMWRHSG